MTTDSRLNRIDKNRIRIINPYGIDVSLFANEGVPVDSSSINELIEFLKIKNTVERVAENLPNSFEMGDVLY